MLSGEVTGSKIEHQVFVLVDRTEKFHAVEQQEHFRRGVCDTLVAIDERVVRRQRKVESGRLVNDGATAARWNSSIARAATRPTCRRRPA